MKLDTTARYNESHEWARPDADSKGVFVIGISDYAQNTLSDIVYVELPEIGDALTQGEPFGVVESVKAAEDVNAPISGEVVAINGALEDEPEIINADPYAKGWLLKVKANDPAEFETLLTVEAYKETTTEE